jgi:hypothetical protein
MNDSKKKLTLVPLSLLALVSFLILMTAIKGDNTLRIVLASVGFLGFGGLLTAALISRSKAKA